MHSITFLINSLGNGGAERVVLTLARYFVEEGRRVRIISLTKSCVYPIPEGVEVIYLSNKYDESSSSMQRMLLIPLYAWRLRGYIQKYQIVLVQSHLFRSNYVNLLSRLLGAKHKVQVVNHSVVSRFLSTGLSGKLNLFLIRYLYPKADLMVTISRRMLDDFNQLFCFPNSQQVIYNPYDTQTLLQLKEESVQEFTFHQDRRYLVTIGRLIPLKQHQDVIQVLAELPEDIELILLGEDGGELDRLQHLAHKLKIEHRVHFLGQVDNPFKFVSACDISILSSRTEGFPNVLIESMLCGTVVISSDCISGPREILSPQSEVGYQLKEGIERGMFGLLYAVGDLVALKRAILLLLEDKELQVAYKERAFNRAKEFAVEHIVSEYRDILEG